MRNQLEQKVLAGETGIIVTKQNEVDFIAFFKQYSKLKPDSNYKISCQHFQNFIGKESFDIKKIDIPLCEQYKEYLLSLDMTAYSALHYFITFKATLNYAVSLKKISNNPAKHISIKYDRKTIERLTLEEVQALMETDCKYSSIKNGFLFSCFTGLRLSDIKNLKFSDIKNNRIKFIQKKTKDEVEFKVHPTAQKIIEEQIKTKRDEFVFHIPDGGKTSQRLRNWIQSAGIEKKITFHCSRHTFGCLLIENGVDVFTVKKLMGHRDIKTTLQYVEKVDETKDKGIDRIPVI
jgi:integrase